MTYSQQAITEQKVMMCHLRNIKRYPFTSDVERRDVILKWLRELIAHVMREAHPSYPSPINQPTIK